MTGHAWAVLLVLCGAIFLEGIDVAMLGVALPSIRADLGLSTGAAVGRERLRPRLRRLHAARRPGRRPARAPPDVPAVARRLLGLLRPGRVRHRRLDADRGPLRHRRRRRLHDPAGLSIITTLRRGATRNRALLVYAGTGAGGFSLGLVVGGLLTDGRLAVGVLRPGVFASLILLAALRLVPDGRRRPHRAAGGFDLRGRGHASPAAMLLLVSAWCARPTSAWRSTVGDARRGRRAAGGVRRDRAAVGGAARPARHLPPAPLVRANLGALLFVGAFFGFQFIVVLYLQELRGWSALETGLALLVIGIDAVLAPTLTPRLVRRFGNVPVILAGMLLGVAAYALFLPVGADWTYARCSRPDPPRPGVRARLRSADHRRHRRRRRGGAGPGRRAAQHLLPVRRGARSWRS